MCCVAHEAGLGIYPRFAKVQEADWFVGKKKPPTLGIGKKVRQASRRTYLAVLSKGWFVPTSLRTCMAMLLSSSLRRQRRLMKEVG